ncbi:MAG: DUF308 domain-containing protein [Eggerthellaceae bacterium]|nr:DUF308 domain-containing protein [Eggerthellaceae bacterium]
MNKVFRAIRSNLILQAVIFVILGLILVIHPAFGMVAVIYILAVGLAVMGLVSLWNYTRMRRREERDTGALVWAIFCLIVAIIFFIFPYPIASVIAIILGLLMIVCGIVNAVNSIRIRNKDSRVWILALIVSILVIAAGCVIVAHPFGTNLFLILMLGITLMVNGAVDIVLALQMKNPAER